MTKIFSLSSVAVAGRESGIRIGMGSLPCHLLYPVPEYFIMFAAFVQAFRPG